LLAHIAIPAPAPALVQHDELDAFQPAQQRMLGLAYDPSDRSAGPGALNGAHDRHGVARIAYGRQANEA
jgi:hypothetical protein